MELLVLYPCIDKLPPVYSKCVWYMHASRNCSYAARLRMTSCLTLSHTYLRLQGQLELELCVCVCIIPLLVLCVCVCV